MVDKFIVRRRPVKKISDVFIRPVNRRVGPADDHVDFLVDCLDIDHSSVGVVEDILAALLIDNQNATPVNIAQLIDNSRVIIEPCGHRDDRDAVRRKFRINLSLDDPARQDIRVPR